MEAPWQVRITALLLEAERVDKVKHQIVADSRYVSKSDGTGAFGDSDVVVGYYCAACGSKGETREEINQEPCRPVKG